MEENDKSILFSFRRCPFAIRTRWALISLGIMPKIKEIDIKKKPIEFIKISPKGTVPVLITEDGEIIDESLEIMKWALNKANNDYLDRSKDSKKANEIINLIKINDGKFKYHLDRYKYSSRFNNQDKQIHKNKAMEILLNLNQRISDNRSKSSTGWLIDNEPSLADWAIWPFIRQFRIVDPINFDTDNNLESLTEWLHYFLNHDNFPLLMTKVKVWESSDNSVVLQDTN